MIFGIYNKVRQSPLAPSLLTKNNSAYKSRKHLGNFVLVQLLAGVEPEEGLQEVSLHVRASTQGLGGGAHVRVYKAGSSQKAQAGFAWLGSGSKEIRISELSLTQARNKVRFTS